MFVCVCGVHECKLCREQTAARSLGTSCVHHVGARIPGNWQLNGQISAHRDHAMG